MVRERTGIAPGRPELLGDHGLDGLVVDFDIVCGEACNLDEADHWPESDSVVPHREDRVRTRLVLAARLAYLSPMDAPCGTEIWRDWARCDEARLSRNPAYDGYFFTCVRTTRIYCRPVCPVAPAHSKNVFFVPTAAAAEHLKYRPCLRCRPETAPGSPAWHGTATTVARGLRLIESGFLDGHSVEELSDKLGIGSRHLARLFKKHLGASPREVAGTRRLQAAKRLITETRMPLAEVAFEAGFNSIRRFNDAFRDTYGRPPSRFRRPR